MAGPPVPPKNASAAAQQRPNQTLYCSNLPDKLQKDDLKRALYMLFSTYGPILDIVALKTSKMRGQAHVLFRDVQSSTQAMRSLQGYVFFGKEMSISYAKSKSDTLAKLDGTYKQPETAPQPQISTLQQSIFAGPPGGPPPASGAPGTQPSDGAGSTLAPPPALKASSAGAPSPADASTPTSQGVKRAREDSDEEDEAPMEMDDAAMEESDED